MTFDLSKIGPKAGAIAGVVAWYIIEAEMTHPEPQSGAIKKAAVIAAVGAHLKDLLPSIGDTILDATALDEQALGYLIDKLVALLHPFFVQWSPFFRPVLPI